MSTAHSKLHLTDDIEVDDGFSAAFDPLVLPLLYFKARLQKLGQSCGEINLGLLISGF